MTEQNEQPMQDTPANTEETIASVSEIAEIPSAEMNNYAIQLRAMTQGRGSYTFDFVRYEEAPGEIANKIIEEAKKAEE